MAKNRKKMIKGSFYYLKKFVSGQAEIPEENMYWSDIEPIMERIRSTGISLRMSIDSNPLFILVSGDNIDGDSNLSIPEPDDEYFYGLFIKKTESTNQYSGSTENGGDKIVINKMEMDMSHSILNVSYFVIEKSTATILLIDNPLVGYVGAFAKYLSGYVSPYGMDDEEFNSVTLRMSKDRQATRIAAYPISTIDSMQQLNNLSKINTVKVVVPWEELSGQTSYAEAFNKLAEDATVNVEISVKSKDRKNGLKQFLVERLISAVRKNSKSLQKLQVEGKASDNMSDLVDFISQRLSVSISTNMYGKYPDSEDVFKQMRESFTKVKNNERQSSLFC